MKKVLLTVSLLLSVMLCLFAGSSAEERIIDSGNKHEASFMINAYKIGKRSEPFLDLKVSDALHDTLTTVPSGAELDLTEYTAQLLETVGEEGKEEPVFDPFENHAIFSFRVSGNDEGTYTLRIRFSPLTKSLGEGIIRTRYTMRSITYLFSKNESGNGEKGGTIEKISEAGIPTKIIDTKNDSGEAQVKWTVTKGTELESWRVQGAVGMIIDRNTFDNASNGKYQATVTIVLTVGD